MRDIASRVAENHPNPRTRRKFHEQTLSVEQMIDMQRFEYEVVDTEPYRPAPIGITAEDAGRPLARTHSPRYSSLRRRHEAWDFDHGNATSSRSRMARGIHPHPATVVRRARG